MVNSHWTQILQKYPVVQIEFTRYQFCKSEFESLMHASVLKITFSGTHRLDRV